MEAYIDDMAYILQAAAAADLDAPLPSDDQKVDVVQLQLSAPDDFNYNPTATDFPQASKLLRDCVKEACIRKLYMKENVSTSPLDFIMKDGLPAEFHKINQDPRGCVYLKLDVQEEDRTAGRVTVLRSWGIEIDAHPENPGEQKPHFGYSVWSMQGPDPKFTGHVWLPQNPPNHCDDRKPGREQLVPSHFEQRKGTTGNLWLYMTKTMQMFRL